MVSYNEYKLYLNIPRLDMKRKNYKYNMDEGINRKGVKWTCLINKTFHSCFFICICVLLHLMVFGVCIYKVEGSVNVIEPNANSTRTLYENKGVAYESNVSVHDNLLNKLYVSPTVENKGIKEDNVFGNKDLNGIESHQQLKEHIRRFSTLSQGNYGTIKGGFGYEYSELYDNMTDEEIDKAVSELMEYLNNSKEKVYNLWWQIMKNEKVKYVMIMKNLYSFFLKLKNKYNFDDTFSEKQWNKCKDKVKQNRLNYEKDVNMTFLNWLNSKILRKDDYQKFIKAKRLNWKELSIKTEKACRNDMLQAFDEELNVHNKRLGLDSVTGNIRSHKRRKFSKDDDVDKKDDGCYYTPSNERYKDCIRTSDYIDAHDSDALVEDEETKEKSISKESLKKEEDIVEDEIASKDSSVSEESSDSRYTILSADSAEYMESDILSVLDVPDVNGPVSARSVYMEAYTPEPKEMLYRPKVRYVTI
ncbi:exported protein (PHISTb) [Plasmodium gaboni]|uniref:Exported protein (PHISTb) n=1 Tax=Plasmodium gaboni TaxID=647221 RepID=A0A151L2U8_9APIC|nr:exported protein (PHISTb) [Plasmodium gaboni]KYN93289.1 exported protein (PHISTb) [Plasmodium gaboni]